MCQGQGCHELLDLRPHGLSPEVGPLETESGVLPVIALLNRQGWPRRAGGVVAMHAAEGSAWPSSWAHGMLFLATYSSVCYRNRRVRYVMSEVPARRSLSALGSTQEEGYTGHVHSHLQPSMAPQHF